MLGGKVKFYIMWTGDTGVQTDRYQGSVMVTLRKRNFSREDKASTEILKSPCEWHVPIESRDQCNGREGGQARVIIDEVRRGKREPRCRGKVGINSCVREEIVILDHAFSPKSAGSRALDLRPGSLLWWEGVEEKLLTSW
jgi:hypothetical protein